MCSRHVVSVALHLDDRGYQERLVEHFGRRNVDFLDGSSGSGACLRDDATITLVLIGRRTWRCATVQRAIHAGLAASRRGRTGLLGILLPSYVFAGPCAEHRRTTLTQGRYWPYNVPPEVHRNVEHGYAAVHPWPSSEAELCTWLEQAARRRARLPAPILDPDRAPVDTTGPRWR